MGRKTTEKVRKKNTARKQEWSTKIFFYFQKEGISSVTMDMVAKHLGKSKSTVYEYFKSKNEILNEVLAFKLNSIAGYKEILHNEELDYIDRYIRFMDFTGQEISDISIKFLTDLKTDFPDHWKLIDLFLSDMLKELHAYYTGGIDRASFIKVPVPLLLAQDQHFIFEILTNPDFLEKHQLDLQQLVKDYLRLKLEGLKK